MDRKRSYSSAIIIIGVMVMALVAGVSLTAYNAERALFGETPISEELAPIGALTQELASFEALALEINDGISGDYAQLDVILVQIQSSLNDLETNANAMQNPQALAFAKDTQSWLSQAQATLVNPQENKRELRALAIGAHEILDKHGGEFDQVLMAGYSQSAELIETLRRSTYRSLIASFVTMFLALLGMTYFMRLSGQTQALADRNETLAKRAYALNDAKSRLLTTLSHELRTPLNGILGLSGILLQSQIKSDDKVMVEQIRESAMDLTNVVSDMLEFTDFATIGTDPSNDLIITHYLFQEIERHGHDIARHYDKSFKLILEPDAPALFRGDYLRLVRSFYYLSGEILKNAPENEFIVHFDFVDNQLIFKTDFDFQYEFDTDWKIEFISEPHENHPDHILSQGLDATMARALLDTMGAKISVLHNEDNVRAHRLLIEIPIERQVPSVCLIAKAEADMDVPQDLSDYLTTLPAKFTDKIETANIILVNFQKNERMRTEALRKTTPDATIIGIGQFLDSESYDYVLNEPIWNM